MAGEAQGRRRTGGAARSCNEASRGPARAGGRRKLETVVLGRAMFMWTGDVIVAALMGFACAFWILDFGLVASLFVAAALSATSVALSVAVWQEAGKLSSPAGQRLLDVAELDDISAVLLLAILLAIAPSLQTAVSSLGEFWQLIASPVAHLAGSLAIFCIAVLFFARFIELPLLRWLFRIEHDMDAMLSVAGIALCIAALADGLGLSVAVGALSAGFVFSGNHLARDAADRFLPVVNLFSPFFFLGIGFALPLGAMGLAVGSGLVLTVSAVAGKVIGGGGMAALQSGRTQGLILGISLVPRAEICMLVAHQGRELVPWAVTPEVFAALAVASMLTSLLSPIALRKLLFDDNATAVAAHALHRTMP